MTLCEHIVTQWNCSYNSWIFILIRISPIKYSMVFVELNPPLAERSFPFLGCTMLGLDLYYSSVYNPQTDYNIHRATELDREEPCCFGEEGIHGFRVYYEAHWTWSNSQVLGWLLLDLMVFQNLFYISHIHSCWIHLTGGFCIWLFQIWNLKDNCVKVLWTGFLNFIQKYVIINAAKDYIDLLNKEMTCI